MSRTTWLAYLASGAVAAFVLTMINQYARVVLPLPASGTAAGHALGLAYLLLPFAPTLQLAAACVLLAHLGGGAQWVLSTYGLQVSTPDSLRGRVLSLDYGLATLAVGASALVGGGAAEAVGLTHASWGLALLSLVYGVGWLWWTRSLWRSRTDVLPRMG